jgi:hypothetical protein
MSLNGGKPSNIGSCIGKVGGNYIATIYVNKARNDNTRTPADTIGNSNWQ